MKKVHPKTKEINESPSFIGATVYIDDVLAAFMTGYGGKEYYNFEWMVSD